MGLDMPDGPIIAIMAGETEASIADEITKAGLEIPS
jgi:hypothetical protein